MKQIPARRLPGSLGCVLLLLGAAYGDSPGGVSECHGEIEMSVTSGSVPGFSWAPDCSIGYLAVDDRGNRSVGLWSVPVLRART